MGFLFQPAQTLHIESGKFHERLIYPYEDESDGTNQSDPYPLVPRFPFLKVLKHAFGKMFLLPIRGTLSKTLHHIVNTLELRSVHDFISKPMSFTTNINILEPDKITWIKGKSEFFNEGFSHHHQRTAKRVDLLFVIRVKIMIKIIFKK